MNTPSNTHSSPLGALSAAAPVNEEQLERLFDTVIAGIQSGATFKDMYSISSDTMEAIYAQAFDFYQQGRLDEAESLFRLLCVYDFHNVDYALGLGAVFQLKKDYDKALDVYAMAYTISGGDARAMLCAGECNLLLRRLGKARRCFEMLDDDGVDARIRKKSAAYLQVMRGAGVPPERQKSEVQNG